MEELYLDHHSRLLFKVAGFRFEVSYLNLDHNLHNRIRTQTYENRKAAQVKVDVYAVKGVVTSSK